MFLYELRADQRGCAQLIDNPMGWAIGVATTISAFFVGWLKRLEGIVAQLRESKLDITLYEKGRSDVDHQTSESFERLNKGLEERDRRIAEALTRAEKVAADKETALAISLEKQDIKRDIHQAKQGQFREDTRKDIADIKIQLGILAKTTGAKK